MRYPAEWYQLHDSIEELFPHLRPAQQRGLSWWVMGTVLARSACESAVLTALTGYGNYHAVRQYLREWLRDGSQRAAPCTTTLEVAPCFAPLLGWVLRWWRGDSLPLAIDATAHGDRFVALVVSVLYRGSAIPVAWAILPANQRGSWMEPILELLRQVAPAVPAELTVLVMTDRGLWSQRLWDGIRTLGWHPLMRIQEQCTFQPAGGRRAPVRTLVPGAGHAWVGAGVAFATAARRRAGTLVVYWEDGQTHPWVLLTDLAPQRVGPAWYGLRSWIELGFRALKGVGWQWKHTRRSDPAKVARHWLVLAVATLWALAYGTRIEDAEWQGVEPSRLRTAPALDGRRVRPRRQISVFRRGALYLAIAIARGRLWRRLWLVPDPFPSPPPSLSIIYHTITT